MRDCDYMGKTSWSRNNISFIAKRQKQYVKVSGVGSLCSGGLRPRAIFGSFSRCRPVGLRFYWCFWLLCAIIFRQTRRERNSMSKPATIELDEIDYKILMALQENARISNVELAERVGLSPAPCLRRVAALEKSGAIKKYVALLDHAMLNRPITMFVRISLD